jgi:outer membrane protein assembly factor BamB
MRGRRRWALAALTALVLTLVATTPARAVVKGDWPQGRRDPAHTSFNPDERQLSPENVGRLRVAWEQPGLITTPFQTIPANVGTPIVADGTVYVPMLNGEAGIGGLAAYDAKTGAPRWGVSGGCPQGLALHAGLLIVGQSGCRASSGRSDLMALDPATGNQVWRISDREVTGAPTVADGVVYVSTGNGIVVTPVTWEVRAVDARTGQIKWTVPTAELSGQPTAVGDRILFCSGPTLFAVAAADGSPLWSVTFTDDWCGRASPTVSGGIVYLQPEGAFGDGVCHLRALRLEDGSPLWQHVAACDGGVAVAYGRVFTSAADHTLLALDATTGTQAWASTDTLSSDTPPPTVANGVVYATTAAGLGAYRASDGARRLLLAPPRSRQPVVAHGFVYVRAETSSFEQSILQALHL